MYPLSGKSVSRRLLGASTISGPVRLGSYGWVASLMTQLVISTQYYKMNFESFKLISLIYTKELIGRQDYSKGKQVWIKPSFDLRLIFVYWVSFPFIIVICLYLIILSAMIQLQIMATTLVNLSRNGFDTRAVEGWRAGSWLGPQGLFVWDVSQNTLLEVLPRELPFLLQIGSWRIRVWDHSTMAEICGAGSCCCICLFHEHAILIIIQRSGIVLGLFLRAKLLVLCLFQQEKCLTVSSSFHTLPSSEFKSLDSSLEEFKSYLECLLECRFRLFILSSLLKMAVSSTVYPMTCIMPRMTEVWFFSSFFFPLKILSLSGFAFFVWYF